jgi:hypothetical protein
MIGWSLAAISVAFGLVTSWVFRRFTDAGAVRATRGRLQAHLLEFRLFFDEPALIWKAQKALLGDNLRLLWLLWRPLLILSIPAAWLFVQLDAVYGWEPLPLRRSAVVTVQLERTLEPADARTTLQTPPGISVETPPVRIFAERQISWRIRPVRTARGTLTVMLPGGAVEKTIAAGERTVFLARRRERSLSAFLFHPEEPRLTASNVAWVEVDYPKADVALAGVSLPWIAWFLLISAASAIAFARWLRSPLL